MKRRNVLFMLAASATLFCATADARSCRVPTLVPEAPVSAQVWREIAEFSFLVGRDMVDDAGNMTLVRRLRPMPEFVALRQEAANWGRVRTRSHEVADALAQLSKVADGLQQFCDQLDAVSLDPAAPLDETSWSAGIAQLEKQLDGVIAVATPLPQDLQRYAGLVRAAATRYAQGKYAPNPVIRIGPSPDAVASGLGEVAGRWRVMLADLQNARRILPVTPERQSERPLIAITTAMREITRVAIEARTLSAQRLANDAFRNIESGDYLYDQCPAIRDGQWVRLESEYWARKKGGSAMLSGSGLILPREAALGFGYELWQFKKIGMGYWLIRNKAFNPQEKALDVMNSSGQNYPLTMSNTNGSPPKFSGQYWRCAATDRAGEIRLYNRFLSEERSVDTYPNIGKAIMSESGYFAAQYWRVVPL